MGAGHDHGHGSHAHGHGAHSHAAGANTRRLKLTLVLAAGYLVAEVVGGIVANSLALLADAGHMLSDVGALVLSLFALWMAQKPATARRTYGYYRTEILAALANSATLIGVSLFIFAEAVQRFRHPEPVMGVTVMWIAVGGLMVNLAGMVILHGGRDQSMNIRGAWLHLLTDALGSVGAIAGGALIWIFGWTWADPAMSVAIALLVLYSSWDLLKESVSVLLEGAPGHIDVNAVRGAMMEVAGVEDVHDLHVWTITSGMDALSAHAVVNDVAGRRPASEILYDLHCMLHDRFGLHHLTIQIEPRQFEEHTCAMLAGV